MQEDELSKCKNHMSYFIEGYGRNKTYKYWRFKQ